MESIKNIKSEKGVTLMVLVLTLAIMMVLIVSISVNVPQFVERKKFTNLQTDITKLKEEIDQYYSKNKSLPICNKYLAQTFPDQGRNDNDNYYVIDLSLIRDLDLNYGKDYYKLPNKEDEISDLKDIYIVNEQSHMIYYPQSVYYSGRIYYTTLVADNYVSIPEVPILLSEADAERIANAKEKLASEELIKIDYEPQAVDTTVTVEGAYNGGLADQTFTQENTGARGETPLEWYVLEVNDKELKLVSQVSKNQVAFKDSSGYDNCLYYLNEITTNLFYNEAFGVTKDRVHAFRLTDIRDAAKSLNGSEYDWDRDFISKSGVSSGAGFNIQKEYSSSGKTYWPGIYTQHNNSVVTNNSLYDEEIGTKITNDTGISRNVQGNPATSLRITNTALATQDVDDTKTLLSTIGTSAIGEELFKNSQNTYWVATRMTVADVEGCGWHIRRVVDGAFKGGYLCSSEAGWGEPIANFRVVVSIPANKVLIKKDGTLSLDKSSVEASANPVSSKVANDKTAPTISNVSVNNQPYFDTITFKASDNDSGVKYYAITKSETEPTMWSPVTEINLNGVQVKQQYGATWARVFYHNNDCGSSLFATDAEVLLSDSKNKYSILSRLEKFRDSQGKFEFLLQYPCDTNEYNRWIQTDNPATTTIPDGTGNETAAGYQAVHIDWNTNYWGGLTKSTAGTGTFIDGSVGHSNWFFALGTKQRWNTGIPSYNSLSTAATAELWVRIDNLTTRTRNEETLTINTIDGEGDYYLWVQDTAGNKIGQKVTVTNKYHRDIKLLNKYDTVWKKVFYHNTKNGTVYFANDNEVLNCNTIDKYSILDKLEAFRMNGNFEFLLEYPGDTTGYNRWIQTSNPATTTEPSGTGSEVATGYQAVHIDWTGQYWGGLGKSTASTSTFIDGSYGHGNWFYSIGCKMNYNSGFPSYNGNITSKVGVLYVRIIR